MRLESFAEGRRLLLGSVGSVGALGTGSLSLEADGKGTRR